MSPMSQHDLKASQFLYKYKMAMNQIPDYDIPCYAQRLHNTKWNMNTTVNAE